MKDQWTVNWLKHKSCLSSQKTRRRCRWHGLCRPRSLASLWCLTHGHRWKRLMTGRVAADFMFLPVPIHTLHWTMLNNRLFHLCHLFHLEILHLRHWQQRPKSNAFFESVAVFNVSPVLVVDRRSSAVEHGFETLRNGGKFSDFWGSYWTSWWICHPDVLGLVFWWTAWHTMISSQEDKGSGHLGGKLGSIVLTFVSLLWNHVFFYAGSMISTHIMCYMIWCVFDWVPKRFTRLGWIMLNPVCTRTFNLGAWRTCRGTGKVACALSPKKHSADGNPKFHSNFSFQTSHRFGLYKQFEHFEKIFYMPPCSLAAIFLVPGASTGSPMEKSPRLLDARTVRAAPTLAVDLRSIAAAIHVTWCKRDDRNYRNWS